MASAIPRSRSHRRSVVVDLLPGKTTRSAPSRSPARSTKRTTTPRSLSSGRKSSWLEVSGNRTTAISISSSRARLRRARSSSETESSSAMRRSGRYGRTPRTGTAVRASRKRSPGSRSVRSPRNLLIKKAPTRARSSGSRSSSVPTNAAKTPPRSMSPTRMTLQSAAVATNMFTRSRSLRLTSAGLPAPSMTTMSCAARSRSRDWRTTSRRSGLRVW